MKSKCQAVCKRCEQGTSGKIYHPEYICADCKIELFEYKVRDMEIEIEMLKSERDRCKIYWQESDKRNAEYVEYKNAFRCLVKELGLKR